MKRSPEVKILFRDETDTFLGFCLAADYVAEHEIGISKLKESFNLNSLSPKEHAQNKSKNILTKIFYKIPYDLTPSKNTANLYVVETKEIIYLCSSLNIMGERRTESTLSSKAYFSYSGNKISGAWDESNFVISLENTDENKSYLIDLMRAEKNNDLIIGFFPEIAKGLLIGKFSELPLSSKELYKDKFKENVSLYLEMINSGIEKLLKSKGKQYFALYPRFIEGKIEYWLNPMNQHVNVSGWFSLEDLKEWAEDKGRIIKNKG